MLDGTATSTFIERQVRCTTGQTGGAKCRGHGALTCHRHACTGADMDARTAERPWGAEQSAVAAFRVRAGRGSEPVRRRRLEGYVAVWVGDDPSEKDGKPLVDGDEAAGQPGPRPAHGAGARLRASSRRISKATVQGSERGTIVSWREVR